MSINTHQLCRRAMLLFLGVLLAPLWAQGQQPGADRAEMEALKAELKRIELRLQELESRQSSPAAPAAVPESATAPAPEPAPLQAVPSSGAEAVKEAADRGMDTMDAGMGGETISLPHIPELKIRGFGDIRGFVANQNMAVLANSPGSPTPATQGGNATFALGLMDLFVTSQITEKFSYLTEIGFEADPASNGVGVDLERAQISYMQSDKFSFSAGRTHAMLGYYNSAFHHGTWFQTTIDRPRIFEFEDSGGPLPIHNIGVSAMGKLPGNKVQLHWFGEVGNGKQTYSLQSTVTPANVLADHTGKSTNIGFYLTPRTENNLRAGFNWYQASLVPQIGQMPGYGTPAFPFPNAASYYKQNIFIAHAIYITPTFEFMAEDAEIRDRARGANQPLYTSGGYAQISRAFGSMRPYFRYQWLNPNFRDPNNAWVGRWVGPSPGVRWDINTFVALKTEFSHFDWKNFSADQSGTQTLPVQHKSLDQLGLQLTYTF
ncbi:hypothetical protein DYQ86_26750 [Acidobacteria bacterium AB60]|nr:hypothetical protein DYQ86_26750 [Acidobacteria bacterium AB60]